MYNKYGLYFINTGLYSCLLLRSYRMDIGKQRKPTVDAKYLHAFAPNPLSQNGQHHGLRHPVEGNNKKLFYYQIHCFILAIETPNCTDHNITCIFIVDSAFKKIKILQEASLEHHPTTVSCPTPARRRHRTTFTQVQCSKYYL